MIFDTWSSVYNAPIIVVCVVECIINDVFLLDTNNSTDNLNDIMCYY